jgi:nucleotide-binding universal stress UspA family protein
MLTIGSRIVVPYDDSELSKRALEMAVTLAKQDQKIELNVITVVNPVIPYYGYPTVYNFDKLVESERQRAEAMLLEIKEKLAPLSNYTRTFLLDGNPGQMILQFVKDNNADLIIMGSRGLSGLKEVFLGSVSHFVVQKAHCPVLVVK